MVWRVPAAPESGQAIPGRMTLVKIVAAQPSLSALVRQIRREFPQAKRQSVDHLRRKPSTRSADRVAMLAQWLRDYYRGGQPGRRLERSIWADWLPHLDLGRVSLFTQSVLRAAAQIPPGRTRSYGEIATGLGRPGAARAVGRALGANPFPVLIPCHRVLGKSGQLTGFSAPGGVAAKKRMLAQEAKV